MLLIKDTRKALKDLQMLKRSYIKKLFLQKRGSHSFTLFGCSLLPQ